MQLSEEILRYEPHNRVVLEYRIYLQQYIDQGEFYHESVKELLHFFVDVLPLHFVIM